MIQTTVAIPFCLSDSAWINSLQSIASAHKLLRESIKNMLEIQQTTKGIMQTAAFRIRNNNRIALPDGRRWSSNDCVQFSVPVRRLCVRSVLVRDEQTVTQFLFHGFFFLFVFCLFCFALIWFCRFVSVWRCNFVWIFESNGSITCVSLRPEPNRTQCEYPHPFSFDIELRVRHTDNSCLVCRMPHVARWIVIAIVPEFYIGSVLIVKF